MGIKASKSASVTPTPSISISSTYNKEQSSINTSNKDNSIKSNDSKNENIHPVNPDIIIHSVVSAELDYDHESAMNIKLGEVSDEQLLAEVARRRIDLHDKITDSLVKETYEVGRVLGHGASGKVYAVTHKMTRKIYACKVVRKNSSINDAQSMSTEIEIMKRIRHRNIVSMYELYETPKCLWIILELVDGGDLHSYLASTPNYNEVLAAKQFKQILQGLHYLHSLGVVHRDLKLANILLKEGGGSNSDLKIADFGLSALVRLDEDGYDAAESSKRKNFRKLTDMWGTKEYFAPEVIEMAYGPQADVWALGCVLYEMLSGFQAFPILPDDTDAKFFSRIKCAKYDLSSSMWNKISLDAKDLISKLLTIDPNQRFSASEALLHPWVTGMSHGEQHRRHLSDAQSNMKARLEKKAKS